MLSNPIKILEKYPYNGMWIKCAKIKENLLKLRTLETLMR